MINTVRGIVLDLEKKLCLANCRMSVSISEHEHSTVQGIASKQEKF
jgi:hypothetical protein